MNENYFKNLYDIDVSNKVEQKNKLNYLSWCYAWAETKKIFPDAIYNIKKFGEDRLPYVCDPLVGYMVFTDVTINNITHEMWLPVMDGANKAMKSKPYTYKVKKYSNGKFNGEYEDKTVEAADMFDINKTIMRCLTKNLAMHGLGLYIYAGEDLPEAVVEEETAKTEAAKIAEEELKKAIKKVVDAGSKLIKDGVAKDAMTEVVGKYNDGNKNPANIKTLEVCNEILKEFKNLTPKKNKEDK